MISLDQVYLLEQKVESAVAKIQQLQAENDALRNKCTELTNALSAKSEQLTSFESDQSQIENGIDTKYGMILGTTCEVPPLSYPSNIHTLVRAAEDFGSMRSKETQS